MSITICDMASEPSVAQALARACFGGGRTRVWAVRYAVLGAVMWQVCCGAASSPIGRLDISLEDARLSAAVRTALLNDRELGVRRISVESHNAIVTLSGTVLSVHEAERAVMLARSRDGVRDVKSDLRVVGERSAAH
jgi:BON domain